uniref:Uncharacterized protein n=1 Tax=Solanum tuberosum TaxID=4113 RepID=M1D849_SOLTU
MVWQFMSWALKYQLLKSQPRLVDLFTLQALETLDITPERHCSDPENDRVKLEPHMYRNLQLPDHHPWMYRTDRGSTYYPLTAPCFHTWLDFPDVPPTMHHIRSVDWTTVHPGIPWTEY